MSLWKTGSGSGGTGKFHSESVVWLESSGWPWQWERCKSTGAFQDDGFQRSSFLFWCWRGKRRSPSQASVRAVSPTWGYCEQGSARRAAGLQQSFFTHTCKSKSTNKNTAIYAAYINNQLNCRNDPSFSLVITPVIVLRTIQLNTAGKRDYFGFRSCPLVLSLGIELLLIGFHPLLSGSWAWARQSHSGAAQCPSQCPSHCQLCWGGLHRHLHNYFTRSNARL